MGATLRTKPFFSCFLEPVGKKNSEAFESFLGEKTTKKRRRRSFDRAPTEHQEKTKKMRQSSRQRKALDSQGSRLPTNPSG